MPASPVLDRDQCARRNRIAARRDSVEATPLRFLQGDPDVARKPSYARGTLPADDAEALDRINATLPAGKPALTAEQVYIHYAEAANGNFVADRFAFLGTSTLKNIASDAERGFAFMNSHRKGGLSSPAELPYGKTFAGRYEKFAEGAEVEERAVVGFYMLRGQHPNGGGGPSTDDFHAGIDGGTIFDVSVGLDNTGTAVCDVCGEEIEDYGSGCDHAPGTHMGMDEEQILAQKARGVPEGVCSYTLQDYGCSEVSAVYDGAVPGAGFRRALAFARRGRFGPAEFAEARRSYAPLLVGGDFQRPKRPSPEQGKGKPMSFRIRDLFNILSQDPEQEIDLPGLLAGQPAPPPTPAIPPPATSAAESETLRQLRARVEEAESNLARVSKENEDRIREAEERAATELQARIKADAESFAISAMKDGRKFLPASRPLLEVLHVQCALDDQARPFANSASRVQCLQEFVGSLTEHNLTGTRLSPADLPPGAKVLDPTTPKVDPNHVDPAAIDKMLAMTETGRLALARRAAQNGHGAPPENPWFK